MGKIEPVVATVILNWNQARLTLDCLSSVLQLDYLRYRVIVVDNGSTDGSAERIHEVYPAVEVLGLDSNLGYAVANNMGIRHALSGGADYVLVLNNDTLVAPTMLTELVEVAESDPSVGMVGPTAYCLDSPDILFAAGSFIRWRSAELVHRGMFQPAGSCSLPNDPQSVDFMVGCGVLISSKAVETAGYLDPTYYLNYEDVEWCVRIRHHGFRVLHAPRAVMWHKVSASLGQRSPQNTYYMTRNGLLFFWRYSPPHLRWIAMASLLSRTLRTVMAWSLKPRYHNAAFRSRRDANLFALRDFFLGRFGEMRPEVARACRAG